MTEDKNTTEEAIASVAGDEKADKSFVTKDELTSFGNTMINNMKDIFKKEMAVHSENINNGRPIPNNELGQDTRGIDRVSPHDFVKQAELEDFMNDILTVYVHPSNDKEDNPVIVPTVNGVNQPIIRGQNCQVKRKFVEALARGRSTRYEQKFPNPSKPHKYVMTPDTIVTNSFVVREDPHPRGAEWLQAILAEA